MASMGSIFETPRSRSSSHNGHVVLDVEEPHTRGRSYSHASMRPDDSVDQDMLNRAVHDAGRWAYGTILVEVWVSSSDKTCLYRPEGGFWLDPVIHAECEDGCPLCRLTDKTVPNYCPPARLAYGEGLPGVLWSEAHAAKRHTLPLPPLPVLGSPKPQRPRHRRQHAIVTADIFKEEEQPTDPRKVVWRVVKDIANDPDQPYNRRLQILTEAGLGLAAAVPFEFSGQQGIVVHMARETICPEKLKSPSNEAYLKSAADLIGAVWALRGPRQAAVEERKEEFNHVREKLIAMTKIENLSEVFRKSMDERRKPMIVQVPEEAVSLSGEKCPKVIELMVAVKKKALTTLKKSKGADIQAPPAFSLIQSLWSFFGALFTLMILTRLNKHLVETHGLDHGILLGPFGALMTLQYGLTAAPASQPRNAILGQAMSIIIAIAFGYLDNVWDLWLRQSFATATAIFCMVKFGLTHPPAGAAALLFSSGHPGWINMGFMLVANLICIFTATIINNLSNERQYPTSYGIRQLLVPVWPKDETKSI